jgi:Phage terminase large subunit (GpA)
MGLSELAAEKNIHVFLETYGVTNDQGEPLDFKDHAYLWDIYEDFSPRQAILKAAQIGISTCINIKALWLAKNRGMDIIYSLPSASDIKDFVSGKTNRLIANNAILAKWTEDKDSIEQKGVGSNVLYFRGTWTERAAIAIPADLYISDETDRSKQEIVGQYRTRLQHSKFAWEWYLSNPSAAGHGVDAYWQESDQKHWFIKCKCGYEWYLTMENIMWREGRPYFGCLKCHEELDRHHGRWIAKNKGKEISGYWIPLLIAPRISAEYILQKKKEYTEEQFTNFVLGLPYVGRGNKLTRPMFLQNLTDAVNPRDTREIIGVDTGAGINYVLGNKHGLFYFERCDDYGPIEARLQQNKNSIAIIDQGGDIIGPRKLREKYPNRVFLCFFGKDRKNDELIRWNDEDGTVIADRNKMIQLCVDEMADKRTPIFGTEADWYNYMAEWLGMYRTVEESDIGPPVYEWHKPATGRCDYPFAQVYWRIGLDRFSEEISTFHEPGGESFAKRGFEVVDGKTRLH